MFRHHVLAAVLAVFIVAAPGLAQEVQSASPTTTEATDPVTAASGAQPEAPSYAIPSPDRLVMPKLDFTPTPEIEADFEKYFYFHREGTSFAEAYADIRECDALSSGSSIYLGNNVGTAAAAAQYGVLPGALGNALGSAIADAIFGSAERRKQRRINMRNCMGYKAYQRYGLAHDQWSEFNFEEGMGRKKEGVRNDAFALQALVASGPKPATKEIGL